VALMPNAWIGTEEQKTLLRKNFHGSFGDRRQELVFIGKDLKHEAIQKLLDDALLTDEEFSWGFDGWKAVFRDVSLYESEEPQGEAMA